MPNAAKRLRGYKDWKDKNQSNRVERRGIKVLRPLMILERTVLVD